MGSRRIVGRLVLAAAAAAGVVAGHAATYVLAFRDEPSRRAAVASAGHSHWSEIVVAALALGVLALGIVVVRRLRGSGGPTELGGPFELALRLAVVQTLLFLALEVGERLTTGWTLAELASHSLLAVLALGVLVQVVMAAIVALVLRAAAEMAEVVGRSFRSRPAGAALLAPRGRTAFVVTGGSRLRSGAWGLRGPPHR